MREDHMRYYSGVELLIFRWCALRFVIATRPRPTLPGSDLAERISAFEKARGRAWRGWARWPSGQWGGAFLSRCHFGADELAFVCRCGLLSLVTYAVGRTVLSLVVAGGGPQGFLAGYPRPGRHGERKILAPGGSDDGGKAGIARFAIQSGMGPPAMQMRGG